jgi:hypothetical protein
MTERRERPADVDGAGKQQKDPFPEKDASHAALALQRYVTLDEKATAWFVLYGVGIAALFVSQAEFFAAIELSLKLRVLWPSLTVPLLRVVWSLILKYQNFVAYRVLHPGETVGDKSLKLYRFTERSTLTWIGVFVDLLSVVGYIWVTFALVDAVAAVSTSAQAP